MSLARQSLAYCLTAALIAGTYPLALVAHLALDAALGDGLLLREWRYGSQRAVAMDVAQAWAASLLWVLLAWVTLALLRRWLGALYPAYAVAAAAVGAGAVGAAVGGVAPVPVLLAWLLLACFALEAVGHALAVRRIAAWV